MRETPSPWDRVTHESLRQRLSHLRTEGAGRGYLVPRQKMRVRLQMLDARRASVSIKCDAKPAGVPSLQLVECTVSQHSDGWWLHVTERQQSQDRLVPFFVDLCRKLEPVESSADAVNTVKTVLTEWNKAFSLDPHDLTRDQMLGLVGELQVLSRLIQMSRADDQADVLSWWQGPDSEDHDFDLPGRFQIEVKASGPATEKLEISNEHQLDSRDKPLYLARVGVEMLQRPAPESRTLPEMVDAVAAMLVEDSARYKFSDLVLRAGLNVLDQRYEDHHFRVYSVDYFSIDDTAPRVVAGDLRPGVSHVRYRINLADLKHLQVLENDLFREV